MKTTLTSRSAHEVIIQSIRFDHDVTGNAKRILRNLREEGYVVTLRPRLPELQRMYEENQNHAA